MGKNRLNRSVSFLFAIVVVWTTVETGKAADINDQMTLVEAIDSVRAQGIAVSYSSTFVKPWMRVRINPQSSDPVAALREALAEYSLTLKEGTEGRWLVVQHDAHDNRPVILVSGRITDATSGAPINFARIRAGGVEARSDGDGRFELTEIAEGNIELLVSADGYARYLQEESSATKNTELEITLQPIILPALDEITIVASQRSIFSNDGTSGQFLTGEYIRRMPHIADDAFRVLHKLPGVAANDFQAPFNLRGGTTDEVKVVLDGLELFEPYHMRNIFSPLSIIDPGIIGQAQVLSGGFTAEYGNQMSGVVDFASEWPTGEPIHQLGVSFVSSFVRSKGTFESGRGAYQFSARRGYLDLIADKVTDEGEELTPRYSDIFAKVNYQFNDTIDLSAQVLSAADDVRVVDPGDGENFGGDSSLVYAWFTVAAEPADGLTWTNMLFAGQVETNEFGTLRNPPFEIIDRTFLRDTNISGLQSDLSWQFSDRAMWKVGARYRSLSTDYDYYIDSLRQNAIANDGFPYALTRDIFASRSGDEYGAYAAFRFQPTDRFTWELGLRWDQQTYADTTGETQVSPRANGFYRISDNTEIRLGWGHFYQPQGIQDLQLPDGVTNFYPAQRAEHRIVGIRHRRESGLEMQVDIYQKKYTDVRPRFENAFDTYEFAPESNFDRIRIEPDSAQSQGVEVTLRNSKPRGLDWWLNYTWSEAEDDVDGLSIPRSWDQRHAFTAGLTWRGERWNLSAIGRYHSGWPRTPLVLVPVFDSGGNFVGADTDFSQRNLSNYDDYSRIDLRLSRTVALTRSNFEFYVEIYNIFNAENPCCIGEHNLQIGPSVTVLPNVDEYLPFFPSFGFVWTFGAGVADN